VDDHDLDGATMRVERSLEETKYGLRSRRGRRTISLPPSVVMVLREHRRKTMGSVCRPLERRARSLRRKPQIPIADQAAALPLGATKCLEFGSELGDLSRFVCVAHQAS